MTKLEIKLYFALKTLLAACEDEFCGGGPGPVLKAVEFAHPAISEVDMQFGPLPDWATDHNYGRDPVKYAQLCTRNGERTGNAIVADVLPLHDSPYYVLTDMGNPMRLTAGELFSMFTIGQYIMDENAVMKRKRQNPDAFGEALD